MGIEAHIDSITLVLRVLPSVSRVYGLSLPCRKRENSLQEDRGSFVTTPTAELSNQEETLLGSLLDWSLECCSGYEGDQESEGEKEGDGECHSCWGRDVACGDT